MEKNGFYKFEERHAKYLRDISASQEITEENKKAIFEFLEYCGSIRHPKKPVGPARLTIYSQRLRDLATWLKKDFRAADKKDLEALCEKIKCMNYSQHTKNFYYITLKKFYKHLEGEDEIHPHKIRWLKPSHPENNLKSEDMLTQAEVLKMINAAMNPRDRAIISVLFEGGFRIGEMASMRIKNAVFDKRGCLLTAPSGKTGTRTERLVMTNYLESWLGVHPLKDNPDAPLWVSLTGRSYGQPLRYTGFYLQLQFIAKAAGITKRVNPHNFRHSSATRAAKLNLSEAQMMARFGWKDSDTARTYIHLSHRDTDNAYLSALGLATDKKEEDAGAWFKCPRCSKQNEINTRYCSCGAPLTTSAAVSIESEKDEMTALIPRLLKMVEQWEQMTQEEKVQVAVAAKKVSKSP